jgi:hypothetical protein
MGRTKDLRDDIPFTPGHFESIEEFASAIGWNLSTKKPKHLKSWWTCVMQENDYQALVASIVQAAIHFEDDWEAIENQVDSILSRYIRKGRPW